MLGMADFYMSCRKEKTKRQYRSSLCYFMETVYGIQHIIKDLQQIDHLESLSLQYLSEEKDTFSDLIKFVGDLKKLSPLTQSTYLNTVLYWLEMNDIIFPRAKLKFLRNRIAIRKILTEDKPLDMDMIRLWYENLSRIGRVILMLMMTSGMRMNEALSITIRDIDFDQSPPMITLDDSYTKNGKKRYTFITTEASFVISEWLKVREKYLEVACDRSRRVEKDRYDERIIPLTQTNAIKHLNQGLINAGLFEKDKRTGRSKITSHSLRKFYISQLKKTVYPEIVEMLAGHSAYLSESYRRYPFEEVREAYKKGQYILYMNNPDVDSIKIDMVSLKEENKELKSRLSEEITYREELDQIKKELEELKLSKNSQKNVIESAI